MTLKTLTYKLFSESIPAFSAILAVSAFSLSTAFYAEAVLLLEPCRLCIYQRYPFFIAALIGILGLLLRKDIKTGRILLGLCALLFLINSGTAVYHTGVEQRWWISAFEGCSVTFDGADSTKTMLENIMSAPSGSCEDIPWADPVFGFSMANYNIVLCFGLFVFCAIAAVRLRKSQPN
jgi:disulfide bond formation protein DsbB